jgi:hypothetical protein
VHISRSGIDELDLQAHDGVETGFASRGRETHHAIEALVVSDRES